MEVYELKSSKAYTTPPPRSVTFFFKIPQWHPFWGGSTNSFLAFERLSKLFDFFSTKVEMIFMWAWLWDGQAHIECHFLLENRERCPHLMQRFCLVNFFVQPGRLLHIPIDGFPQNYRTNNSIFFLFFFSAQVQR